MLCVFAMQVFNPVDLGEQYEGCKVNSWTAGIILTFTAKLYKTVSTKWNAVMTTFYTYNFCKK